MGRSEGAAPLFREPSVYYTTLASIILITLFAWIFNLINLTDFSKANLGALVIYEISLFFSFLLNIIGVNELYENHNRKVIKVQSLIWFLIAYGVVTFGIAASASYIAVLPLWWGAFINSWIYEIVEFLIAFGLVVGLWD